MKELLIDNVVKSYLENGSIRTGCGRDDTLDVIYRSLDSTARFNGITEKRHTVLVHSWFVGILASELAPEGLKDMAQLAGMMHDFGEVIVGDFVKPMKSRGVFYRVYMKYYEPLERAFRSHVGNEVLGIDGFDAKYASVEQYVAKADSVIGELELYGDILDMDDDSLEYVNRLFREMDGCVSRELFGETLEKLSSID